ncbi:hypothetical protein F1188_20020 [Roseospira marina]|uniref:Uncharacterized protein n=1 Tax=Roseospira marina TaxID=140057 RepID=A0A5M6I491_9PROT|nr:hypothetical protein [Roseospira marina]KAA5603020.1 hypothetical protein F1188_20020 [Roseospira marina]MBB4313026.1 hypothetical protein [Roseospira marina]MBB5089289.1 hypothetical protein [Roseospira marina]
MPVEIDLIENLDAVKRDIADFSDRQVPFAMMNALTRTANAAKDRARDEIDRVFDRPTKYTRNSLFVRAARKARLEASVNIKDFAPKGTPAFKYLAPQIEGGPRREKRFERALQAAGHLPRGTRAVPGEGIDLDRSGAVSRGQITKILSYLRASPDPMQNRGATAGRRVRRRDQYFLGRPKNQPDLPEGVWKRERSRLVPTLVFVRRAEYRPRFAFADIIHGTVEDEFGGHFRDALHEAHATRRD